MLYHPSLDKAHALPFTLPHTLTHDTCRAIFHALEAEGFHALFVGGCVRDSLLQRPIYDIDVATTARPSQTIHSLNKHHIPTYPTGIDHGTITARLHHRSFEITSLRVDEKHFGRHAQVAFSQDWQQDAQRRDFTMNALYAHIDGIIYDFFHGIEDLKRRHVRFIGDPHQRIKEDYLRILRYFRFMATHGPRGPRGPNGPRGRYGRHLHKKPHDNDALNACTALAPHLRNLSPQRIWKEIRILLRTKNPCPTLRLMQACHIFTYLPTPIPSQNLDSLKRLIALDGHYGGNRTLRRAACMLYHTPPHHTDTTTRPRLLWAQSWRLSHKEKKHMEQLFHFIHKSDALFQRPLSSWRSLCYHHGMNGFRDVLLLHYSHHMLAIPRMLACVYALMIGFIIRKALRWKMPSFPLTGHDIIALGVPKGPHIGALLAQTETWWLCRQCRPDATQCKHYAQKRYATTSSTTSIAKYP